VVSAGKLRKLWESLSELRSSVCERRVDRTVLRPALMPVKTAYYTQFSVSYDVTKQIRSVSLCVYRMLNNSVTSSVANRLLHKRVEFTQ